VDQFINIPSSHFLLTNDIEPLLQLMLLNLLLYFWYQWLRSFFLKLLHQNLNHNLLIKNAVLVRFIIWIPLRFAEI